MPKFFFILMTMVMVMARPAFPQNVKMPNVSGAFYPSDKNELQRMINMFLLKADIQPSERPLAAIVVPHAGYIYSGPVAGYSFKFASTQKVNTIVVLAASHYHGFDGLSIGTFDAYQTPLGDALVDKNFAGMLAGKHPKFLSEPRAFDQEHSLEVEIPFLQTVFPKARIVPVIFGQPTIETIKSFAKTLNEAVGKRDDVLIVASTDLSHYHDGNTAEKMDHEVMKLFETMNTGELWLKNSTRELEMCGYMAVTAALYYAEERKLSEARLLNYAHSGNVTGDMQRVVGYGAMAIYANERVDVESGGTLNSQQRGRLLRIARDTISLFVHEKKVLDVSEIDPRLQIEEGAFVTIKKQGALRGCIGNILGRGPLYMTVRDMAVSSCSQDPRFMPLSVGELPEVDIEISVLSKPRTATHEEIELGTHGVIISRGFQGGVFLPQVATETGWSKEEFLSQLCSQKAGLNRDCWKDPKTKIEIFTAEVFSEK